jgi:hypothetical protein
MPSIIIDPLKPLALGDSRTYTFAAKNADGSPINLTGAQVTFTLRSRNVYRLVLAALTTENGGITITDAPGGLASIKLPPSATKTATAGDYDLDVLVVEQDGTVGTEIMAIQPLIDHPSRAA